jgi:hypothetical protein
LTSDYSADDVEFGKKKSSSKKKAKTPTGLDSSTRKSAAKRKQLFSPLGEVTSDTITKKDLDLLKSLNNPPKSLIVLVTILLTLYKIQFTQETAWTTYKK